MSGIVSEEFGGCLRVVFHPVDRGMVPFDLVLHGDVTMRTSNADLCASCEPMTSAPGDVTVHMRISSALGGFGCFISWLEAVTCGVQDCAFSWDGEGPDGELRWHGPFDVGMLTMSWTSGEFDYGVCMNKAQMVRAFYESFRNFVESERYDPLMYETLQAGEIFALVLDGGDLGALADHVATLSRDGAELFIGEMLSLAAEYESGYPRRATIAGFMARMAQRQTEIPEDRRWIPAEWEQWSSDERRSYVTEHVYAGGTLIGFGERLRELRSPLVEKWLAEHEQADSQDGGKGACGSR